MHKMKEKVLCKPLQQLKNEHAPLLKQMNKISRLVHEIQQGSFDQEWDTKWYKLYQNVVLFLCQLKIHTYQEEHFLFPLLKRYLEEEGTLMVMDYEHKKAMQTIIQFLETFEKRKIPFAHIEALSLLSCIEMTNLTIIEHLSKEEEVLFPLAERYLSPIEKDLILEKMNAFLT